MERDAVVIELGLNEAYLRMRAGADAPDLEAIRRHLDAAGPARPKWPEALRVVEEFPRTPSDKIMEFVLRAELREDSP